MNKEKTFFNPEELMLSYTDFKYLWEGKADLITAELREWLFKWQQWDQACSPMDDKKRSCIRYGHYLGWFSHKQSS